MSTDGRETPTGEVLQFRRLSMFALPPLRSSATAASYDLFSAVDVSVPAQGVRVVSTDIAFRFPQGYYGRLLPRTGLARQFYIDVGCGVIHPDFTDNVTVTVFNFSRFPFHVSRGDKLACITLERMFVPPLLEVDEIPPLPLVVSRAPSEEDPLQQRITRWLS